MYNNTKTTKFQSPIYTNQKPEITDIKICNGRCAYGHFTLHDQSFLFIVLNGENEMIYYPKVYKCPYVIKTEDIMDVYYQKINEKYNEY